MKPTKDFKMSKTAKRALATGSVISRKMWIEADLTQQNRQILEAEAISQHKAWKNASKENREAKKEVGKKNTVKTKRQK